jgi:hypothetical protein
MRCTVHIAIAKIVGGREIALRFVQPADVWLGLVALACMGKKRIAGMVKSRIHLKFRRNQWQ